MLEIISFPLKFINHVIGIQCALYRYEVLMYIVLL